MPRSRIYDSLVNAPRATTAHLTLALIDRVQGHHQQPGAQIAALSAAFLLLCERFQVSPQDAFTATKNLMNDHDGRAIEFEAVRMYLQNEVK